MAFFSRTRTRFPIGFDVVAETLPVKRLLLEEETTIGLTMLLAFFVESGIVLELPLQEREAKFAMYMESWQKDEFYTQRSSKNSMQIANKIWGKKK